MIGVITLQLLKLRGVVFPERALGLDLSRGLLEALICSVQLVHKSSAKDLA